MVRMLSHNVRIKSFEEVSLNITEAEAITEANRCLLCEDPPCQTGCPTSVEVKKFIRKIKWHDFLGAFLTIYENNPILRDDVPERMRQSRLRLAAVTAETLRLALDILGIRVLERL
jgi:NADPH-dependent glutamate synthase beta subunit-like oxidoreductase